MEDGKNLIRRKWKLDETRWDEKDDSDAIVTRAMNGGGVARFCRHYPYARGRGDRRGTYKSSAKTSSHWSAIQG